MDDIKNERTHKQSKEPNTPLAGPYGHPIHPVLVTVPIGAWMSSVAFDFLAGVGKDDWSYAVGAKRLIDIGIITASGAAVFGLLDFLRIERGTKAWYTGLMHMGLNAAAIGLFAVNSANRAHHLEAGPQGSAVTPVQRTMSIVTAMSLLASGWLGGTLVYHYGVRVAGDAEQRQSGFAETGFPPLDELLGTPRG